MSMLCRCIVVLLGVVGAALGEPAADLSLVRESGPLTPEEEWVGLRVPEGFEIQLFAAEPQIHKPINLGFDERGRLWVSSSNEYPYAARRERWEDAEGSRVKESRDGIFILEDTDGDGRADKKTVFADGLNIPTGVLPIKGGCIAWSIPNIWLLEDTDGDDVCDRRRVLFGPLGWEKDVHGNCSSFRAGRDGWIYGTHGFSNTSHFKVRPENLRGAKAGDPGTELVLHSGNIYRFRPDGSRIERFTAGQVNPFGLAWDRWGHLYSADCHSAPIYQLIPSAVYPSFGKPHDGLGFGPEMIRHTHDSTGICGIVYVDGDRWGPEWNDRTLIGNVVTSRVNLDRLTFAGSTPTAHAEPDFLTSEDPWFRPVDLQFGPDGALYVADFYNKIIGHYEVPLTHPGRDRERGRIWRVVKNGATGKPVREGAVEAVAELRFAGRAGRLSPEHVEKVSGFLKSENAQERRVAVEVLGNPVSLDWLPRLLALFSETPRADAALRHLLKIVIRQHLRLPGAVALLEEQRMSPVDRDEMLAVARAVDSVEAAAFVFHRLKSQSSDGAEVARTLTSLARKVPTVELMDFAQSRWAEDAGRQVDLLGAIVEGLAQEGTLPPGPLLKWGNELAEKMLAEKAEGVDPAWQNFSGSPSASSPWGVESRRREGGESMRVISSLASGLAKAEQATGRLVSRPFAAPARFSFWLCGHDGPPDQPAQGLNGVKLLDAATGAELRRVAPPRHDAAREVVWDLTDLSGRLVRLELDDAATGDAYAWLGAGDFTSPAPGVEALGTEAVLTQRLVSLAMLLKYAAPTVLRDRLANYLPPPPPAPPTAVTAEQQVAADQLIAERIAMWQTARPDAGKGEAVFARHCAMCHAVRGEGALVGPQLDGIGHRGVARLMEDVLDPGRNVDAHFRLHVLTRHDGSVLAGLERGEVGQVLIMVDAAGQEQRLPKGEIQTNVETGLSLMPAVFGAAIPQADLMDLIAWMLQQK